MNLQLSTELILAAYSHGYFPMPHPTTGEICWFNPDPRAVLPLSGFHVSRSLRRTLHQVPFEIKIDHDFEGVIDGCADRPETWINPDIRSSFLRLFAEGHAHSFEVWLEGKLVGGTYGLAIGGAFFAESKFHRVRDASKVAIYYLTEHLRAHSFQLLEVQFMTDHLKTLGVIEIKATDYEAQLRIAVRHKATFHPFTVPLLYEGARPGPVQK